MASSEDYAMRRQALTVLILLCGVESSFGAVGCTLNNPDRDIKRLFPKATNYRTEFITIKDHGGKELAREIEAKLKDKLEPRYERIDVPYAYYTVLRKKETIGYVHGVKERDLRRYAAYSHYRPERGNHRLPLSEDILSGIEEVSRQEVHEKVQGSDTGRFLQAGLYKQDLTKKIKDPSGKSSADYLATLRGIRKNLILHDEFKLNNRYDKVFYSKKKESKDAQADTKP